MFVATLLYHFRSADGIGTTTTEGAATSMTTTTTTTLPVLDGTVWAPDTTNPSWQTLAYDFRATPQTTVPQDREGYYQYVAKLQEYALANGYNAFIQDDNDSTMRLCQQGNATKGNTLVVYKNDQFWCALDTSIEFGPNLTIPFTNVQLGRVMTSLQRNSNNLALIYNIIDPTSPATTLVSGIYSVDAAMLNISSDRSPQNNTTWFYGGTTFPYAYTITSFVPKSAS